MGVPVTQHAILLIEDMQEGASWQALENTNDLLQNYEIYIGNEADYKLNQKCEGGPFMRTDDIQSYSYDGFADVYTPEGYVWNYGFEKFCNLEGRYTHIVADLSHLTDPFTISLCSVGIMGTQYTRSISLASTIQVNAGETLNFSVEHVQSYIPIGT